MGIKKYIFASLILLLAITGYIFSIESGDYRVELFDSTYVLPTAIWVIAPAVILFIFTLFHMFYFGLKSLLKKRSIQKDNENILLAINKKLLGQEIKEQFKSDELKEVGNILSQLNIKISDTDFSSTNNKINETAEQIINIKGGKYVSSKDLKLADDSTLAQKNLKNRIDIDDNFTLEVAKHPDNYNQEVFKYAFVKIVENKSMTTIKKLLDEVTCDVDMLKVLVKRDSQENNEFSLENSDLLKIINKLELTNEDLISIAREYKKTASPDQLIKLFEDIVTNNEKLTESYLYILTEYEMIDEIREVLVNSQKDEFAIYKAYLDLRDAGKHYSLDTFLK
jgi:hypothetical protein